MSDDFDFELDFPPKVDVKEKNTVPEKDSSKSKLSLMDKLALLKKNKSSINEEPQIDNKKLDDSKNEKTIRNPKEQDVNNNTNPGNVSNLQKMLNKIKSNNDSIKKQNDILTEKDNIIEKKKDEFEDKNIHKKTIPNNEKTINIMDTVKINENFDRDFKGGNQKIENGSIKNDLINNRHEKNEDKNKSNLDLSDSIQEIEDIIEPPEKHNLNIGELSNDKIEQMKDKIKNNSDFEKVLNKINIFPDNKKGIDTGINNKVNDSLEMLISETNLNEIELIEEKKNDSEEKDSNKMISTFDKIQEEELEKKEACISKGSFDINTDEENDKRDKENLEISINKSIKVRNLHYKDKKERPLNNSNINNEIERCKNKYNESKINNTNPFVQRDSNTNFNDSKKNDDFDVSQNLVNLSNEIQEYKSSNDIIKLNSISRVSKDINNHQKGFTFNDINKEKKEIDMKNKFNEEYKKSVNLVLNKNDSLFDEEKISNKKNDDSLFDNNKNLEDDNKILNYCIKKENAKNEITEPPKAEEKNIKDIFKSIKDDENDEYYKKSEEKDLKAIFKNNYELDETAKNIKIESNTQQMNEHKEKPSQNLTFKVSNNDVQNLNNKSNSLLDVDDIPEIEENDEEDINIINLDRKEVKNNLFDKPENKVFNIKNKNDDIVSKTHNQKNEIFNLKKENNITENKNKEEMKIDKIDMNNDIKSKVVPKSRDKDSNKRIIDMPELFSSKNSTEKVPDKNNITKKNNNLKSYTIKTEIVSSQENNVNDSEKVNIKTEEIIELVNKKNNNDKIKFNKEQSKNLGLKEDKKINKILKTEDSHIVLDSQPNELQIKINKDITNEIKETEQNLVTDKELNKHKRDEIPGIKQKKKTDHIDIDRISIFSEDNKIDCSKFKIFIDFNDPDKVEQHLNEILGTAVFNERVKEKNIRFLLRRKSVINNEMFTSFILREYNIINKIKKIPFNYSSKVEEILNEYLNEYDYDNVFKKAIGDDNNNKQNLIKLLQKDSMKDKSFYLFDNISCLYNMEAFVERYNLINQNFDMAWDPSKVLKNNYDEEEIIHLIYKKKEENKKENSNNDLIRKESEQIKILKSENDAVNMNSFNDDIQLQNENERKNVKNNLNTSKNISKLNNNDSIIPLNLSNLSNEIKCWRESVSDGDSFYRMFMFSLIEYYILNKNLHEIKKILFDVNRIYETSSNKSSKKLTYLFSSKEIDYSVVVIIFNLIIESLKKNQIEKAYDILLNAYNLEDKSFDLVLIGYMRIVLWHIINEIQNYPEIINMENKSRGEKGKKDYEEVNFDTINTFQLEPYKLCLNLASSIFNVNLEIIYLDSSPIPNVKHEKIKCSKIKFNYNSIHETPTINLLYNFNCYGKYYTNTFYEKNKNILGKYYSKIYKKISFEDKYVCDKCGKKTKKVIFKKYEYSSCLDCLKIYLELILFERVKFYEIENFLSREFYCRPIAIKQKFIIDDFDYLNIFGFTIISHLMDIIRRCCFACDLIKTDEPIYNLDCTCNYCNSCLKTKISELTNNNFVLNTFEKNIYLNSDDSKRLCGCNTIFDIESGLKALKMNVESHRKNANKRLDEIVAILCMKCGADSRSNEEGFSQRSNLNFTKIKIKDSQVNNINALNENNNQKLNKKNISNLPNTNILEESKYISFVDHILCINCIDDYSRRLINNDQNNKNLNDKRASSISNQDNKTANIFCNICEAEHCLEAKAWNNIIKKKACCQNSCQIF